MTIRKRAALVVALLVTVVGLGACTYATPDPSSVGLAYTGGDYDTQAYEACIQPGANQAIDTNGTTAYYPTGLRTFDFSDRPGADAPPIAVSTKNNQELLVSGTMTFYLDTDCTKPYTDKQGREWKGGILQAFHDTIGRSKGAAFGPDSDQVPQGWKDTLGLFLGGPANRAMDQTGSSYTWQTLYSDQKVADSFTQAVAKQVPDLLIQQTGGNQYFTIKAIQLDKPRVSDALRAELDNQERQILAQQTAKQQELFAASFPGGLQGLAAFQRQQAETECIRALKCTLIPNGASVPVPAS